MKISLKNYEKNGWIKIKKFVSSSNTEILKKKINEFLEKNYLKYEPRYINFVDNKKKIENINSFHKLDDCKWVKIFSKNNEILNVATTLLKTKLVKLRQAEYFAKPLKKGLAAPNHQDNFFWNLNDSNAITVWIALSNSDKKNGGIYYYNGSHKYGILKHKKSFMKGTSQTIKDKNFIKNFSVSFPILKKGDALIHHSLIIHGSKKNISNFSRKGITFQYITKKAKVDKKRKKNYEKKLLEQLKKR